MEGSVTNVPAGNALPEHTPVAQDVAGSPVFSHNAEPCPQYVVKTCNTEVQATVLSNQYHSMGYDLVNGAITWVPAFPLPHGTQGGGVFVHALHFKLRDPDKCKEE